jgi:phosphatidylglycerol:prolipoprotein diacylglycerol transferase
LIRWRRRGLSDRTVLGRYFVGVGAFRFALEFVRVNTRVLGPLTVAHIFSLAVVALGVALLVRPTRPA